MPSSCFHFWGQGFETMSVPDNGPRVGTNYRALPLGRSRPEYTLTSDPVRRRRIHDMSPKRYALYHYMHQELHQLDHSQLSTMLLKLAEKQTSEHLTQRIFKNVSMWSWRNVLSNFPLGPVQHNWVKLPQHLKTHIESCLLQPFERVNFQKGFLRRTPALPSLSSHSLPLSLALPDASPSVLAVRLVLRAVLLHLSAPLSTE
jgi:hypothetical protein